MKVIITDSQSVSLCGNQIFWIKNISKVIKDLDFSVRFHDVEIILVLEDFDFVYWNMMHDAWYFSIACLPDSAKTAIAEYLDSVDTIYRSEFDRIRDFMNSGASTDGFMTRMKIADLDRKRNQDLVTVAPELAELLNYVKT